MGLDMYLRRSRYVKNWDHDDEKKVVTLTINGAIVPLENVSSIVEEVGYWRKANQIHKFFVDIAIAQTSGGMWQLQPTRGDDCLPVYVEIDDLKRLRDLCQQVLDDHSKAQELLPTQGGFFFGGTEYDESYFQDLEDTIKILDPLIAREDVQDHTFESYYYEASW